jgi:hypothetical protein
MSPFFTPSEHAIKLRRNLLFLCITYILHTSIEPLTKLKVFDVNIPSKLLEYGIPMFIFWFAFNYFYYLLTEKKQWEADSLERENGEYALLRKTGLLTPIMAKLKPNIFVVHSKIEGKTPDNPIATDEKDLLEIAFNEWAKSLKESIKKDVEAIERFEKTFDKYHILNKTRYYALDNGVPIMMMTTCLISGLFYYQVL